MLAIATVFFFFFVALIGQKENNKNKWESEKLMRVWNDYQEQMFL